MAHARTFSRIVSELGQLAKTEPASFSPQNISGNIWSLVKLGVNEKDVFDKLSEVGVSLCVKFSPQGVSNILSAFSKVGYTIPEPFKEELIKHILTNKDEYAPQDITNVLLSLTKLYFGVPENVLKGLVEVGIRKAELLTPRDVAGTLRALATLDSLVSEGYYGVLCDAGIRAEDPGRQLEFHPNDVTDSLLALSKLKSKFSSSALQKCDSFVATLCRLMEHKPALRPKDVTAVKDALSNLGIQPSPALQKVLEK